MKFQVRSLYYIVALSLGLTTLFGPGTAFGAMLCEDAFATTRDYEIKQMNLGNRQIEYRKIEMEQFQEVDRSSISEKSDDLFIGVSEFGHAYLVADRTRVDGDIFPRPTKVTDNPLLDAGIVIRIKNATVQKDNWDKYQSAKRITCTKTACEVLAADPGIRVDSVENSFVYPHKMLKSLLENGLVDNQGSKVPFDIFYLGKEDLKSSLDRIERRNNKLAKGIATRASVALVSITLASGAVLWVALGDDN